MLILFFGFANDFQYFLILVLHKNEEVYSYFPSVFLSLYINAEVCICGWPGRGGKGLKRSSDLKCTQPDICFPQQPFIADVSNVM